MRARGGGAPERGCELRRGRALGRLHRQGLVDEGDERLREVGARGRQRRSAAADPLRDLEERPAAERVASGECLPEQDADRPDVGCGPGGLAAQPLRRDVGERSGHIPGGGQRLLLGDEREAEVEEPDREVDAVREQDVRRLHVAVDDPARVRVREPLEDLRGRFDRVGVVELAALERVTQRAAGDVLVGDVHVAFVPRQRVRAYAGRVTELGRGRGLALGAGARGARPRHDLQGDLAAVSLVVGMPDRPHAAAAERSQGPVAPEHEAGRSLCCSCLRHPAHSFRAGGRTPSVSRGMG